MQDGKICYDYGETTDFWRNDQRDAECNSLRIVGLSYCFCGIPSFA
jgi:hypothetical protein